MIDLKEFRSIADRSMSDIVADSRLKEKVLAGRRNKHPAPVGRLLAAAACFVIIIGTLNLTGLLQFGKQPDGDANPESFIGDARVNVLTADAAQDNVLSSPAKVTSWELLTPEEAKKAFGSDLLLPSYIPETYKLHKIFATGERNRAQEVLIQYRDGDRYFIITEDRIAEAEGLSNYERTDINGAKGYKKAGESDLNGREGVGFTEVHWFRSGVHYAVSGQITEDEAVKIAESMK